jgi:hypothetical protein
MYWVKHGETYEVLDGQQRTMSFCRYVNCYVKIATGERERNERRPTPKRIHAKTALAPFEANLKIIQI